ncbi:MAG: hypothetical protein J3K34DRAFT_515013 [Monoraphidium minutum]|nr:MAG: hypothetical protein J3K34DRAFT_515013 [Monoraphidium minutum]
MPQVAEGDRAPRLPRRALAAAALALAAAPLAAPRRAAAGLEDYNASGAAIEEIDLVMGAGEGQLAFSPATLSFTAGRVYKLHMTNPSQLTHYFTALEFASKARRPGARTYTILVLANGVEVKGAVSEVALKKGAEATWVFVPIKPGRYPLRCSVKGHTEGGMVGEIFEQARSPGAAPAGSGCANGAAGAAAAAPPSPEGCADPPARRDQPFDLLRGMAALGPNALLALPEAAELIRRHMRADVVGIAAFDSGDPECAVLLAARGGARGGGAAAAAALRREPVMRGGDWAAAWAAESLVGRLSLPDAADAGDDIQLPIDVRRLWLECGVRCFEVVEVKAPGGPPLGALLIGCAAPRAFGGAGEGASPWLEAATAGLLPLMSRACVPLAAGIAPAVCEAGDLVAAVSALLQGAARFVWRATNVAMVVRLALLVDGPASDQALVFESARAGDGSWRKPAGSSRSLPLLISSPAPDVTVRHLPLGARGEGSGRGGTLLERAFASGRTITVHDTASYMQNARCPARDLFPSSSAATGVAVIPMYASPPLTALSEERGGGTALSEEHGGGAGKGGEGGARLGGLYFCPSMPVDFDNIKDALTGLMPTITSLVELKMTNGRELQELAADASQTLPSARLPSLPGGSASGDAMIIPILGLLPRPAGGAGSGDTDSGGEGEGGSGSGEGRGLWRLSDSFNEVVPLSDLPPSLSSKLSVLQGRNLSTSSMVKVLQRAIHRDRRCSMELSFTSDLTLVKEIGRGGFGTVYSGFYRRLPAAIKVMDAREHEGEALTNAMEMAVLSSVQHPNIVQLYSCLLGMVAANEGDHVSTSLLPADPGAETAPGAAERPPRFRRLLPGEDRGDVQTYNLIVMELCDKGSLADALRQGVFHKSPAPGLPPAVDLPLVIDVLLDVATSLQYLHDSANLVHGDIKLDNILLKSSPSSAAGLIPKTSDFGLTKVMGRESGKEIINTMAAGTITHLAPELLVEGSEITAAVDAYAFGILMWEMYAGQRAFEGVKSDDIIARVIHQQRPTFPPGTPPAYALLAGRCWVRGAHHRPSAAEIVCSLRQMRGGC